MKTLKDFNFKEKKVLVRCDFNIPLNEKGDILDDFRIKKTILTIKYLIERGAKLILISHLGRPEGKVVEQLRFAPVQKRLKELLGFSIDIAPDCIGENVINQANSLRSGEILLLENLKFHIGEEKNEDNFTKKLAELGEIYINDAFASCHQSYASIIGLPKYLPSGAGFLLEKEIQTLSDLIKNPKKPLIAIVGGKKVETKAKLIDTLSELADFVLVGNLIEKEIKEKSIKLKYPQKILNPIDSTQREGKDFDIGSETIKLFKEKIALAKTIFWAGPLGKVEEEEFQIGTIAIAKAVVASNAFSVIGGGDTLGFINKLGLTDKFSHISTGGGALLDFIVDGSLVGIEALN